MRNSSPLTWIERPQASHVIWPEIATLSNLTNSSRRTPSMTMPMRSRLLPLLLCAAYPFTSAPAQATDAAQASAAASLLTAHTASNLSEAALKPWHMLVSFDLLNPDSSIREHGKLELWWAAPQHWHRRIVSPSFNQDLYRVGDQSFSATPTRLPYFLGILAHQLISPIPKFPDDLALTIEKQTKTFGPAQLDCILVQPAKRPGQLLFGVAPTYCLEQQHPVLRFFMENSVEEIMRNRPGVFQDKSVALDLKIEEAGHPTLHATIDQLKVELSDEADVTPPANLPPAPSSPVVGISAVMAGHKIGGPAPQYPAIAKSRHITGTVLLRAIVGRDGHITSTEVISSPDASLSKAAMDAVNRWVYQPYLLNGAPVEVDTTITVNFNISG